MDINSLGKRDFCSIVGKKLNKDISQVEKDTFTFSTKDSAITEEEVLKRFKFAGGMSQAADVLVETAGKKDYPLTANALTKDIINTSVLNSPAEKLLEGATIERPPFAFFSSFLYGPFQKSVNELIFGPVANILPENFLPSGASKIDENIISVDINKAAGKEDFMKKDIMEDKPSHRVYIGFDPADPEAEFLQVQTGYVYVDKLEQ
jgi:hypothetical protein